MSVPAYAAKGSGRKLIERCGQHAYENGFPKMVIDIVTGNERAEGVYTHLGAEYYKDFTEYFADGMPSQSKMFIWKDTSIFKKH